MNKNTWSLYPPEVYTRRVVELDLGIGYHQALLATPGAWNIFCLIAPNLETIRNWNGAPEDYPIYMHWIPVAIGASYQQNNGIETCGSMALRMTPKEFVEEMEKFDAFLPRLVMGAERYHELTAAALVEFTRFKANVLPFRRPIR